MRVGCATFVLAVSVPLGCTDAFGRRYNAKKIPGGTRLHSTTAGSETSLENAILAQTTSLSSNPFEPAVDFDWKKTVDSVFATEDKRPVVLFDGVCNLCNGGVNFALDHDQEGNFRFVSLQSKVGQSLLLASGKAYDDMSSIVVVEMDSISKSGKVKTKAHFKSDAVLRIATSLDIPVMKLAGKVGPFVPAFFRNIAYNAVAENRYRFGEADQCRLWDDNFDGRFIADPED